MASRPWLIFVAGPNGSGKTTLTTIARRRGVDVVDPDAIARDQHLPAIAAGRAAIERVAEALADRRSLLIETTFAGARPDKLVTDARDRGYRVGLIYVSTGDVEITVRRVRERVARGGHDVPESDVRRRFTRSLENAVRLAGDMDYVRIVDNSGASMVLVARRFEHRGRIDVASIPAWATSLVAAALRSK
jgi:predicted ABC-type ATPase